MNHEQQTEQVYLSYSEAARLLGMKLSSVYSMVCRKRLPHRRLSGRCVRFNREELLAWIESKAVRPVGDGPAMPAR